MVPNGPKGRLRIDRLNPDLLTGPDVERWREVYDALSKSEMPPEDEPEMHSRRRIVAKSLTGSAGN